jgi:hypothetical protein
MYGGQENPVIEAVGKPNLMGITGFTDPDWAGDEDSQKSTSRYVFLLHGGAVSWKSTKQSVAATSSTETEYIVCSKAAKKALWIQRLNAEIQGTSTSSISTTLHRGDQHETDI